jgi:hypothetical protein
MSDFGLLVHDQTVDTMLDFYGPGWQTAIENAVPDDLERFRLFFVLLHEFRNGKTDAWPANVLPLLGVVTSI